MSSKEATNPEMVTIEVDGVEIQAPKGSMLIEATDSADISVPRFCYHKKLSVAANCRMCLVEVERAPKPLPACATPVADGMKVFTKSERAIAAQRGVMEFLLINHPLDCPICDQGGECELQDLALGYGRGISRFTERKRVVQDENLGPLISTDMTRCIHCTRCVRFLEEVAGQPELGGMGRGEHTLISTYVEQGVHSEMSGNIIDLCPVGALTSKPFRFTARAWELLSHPSVAPHDCVGSNVHLHHRRGKVMRVVPDDNEQINEVWLSDRDRFSYQGIYAEDRLASPMVKRDGAWEEVDWEQALEAAVKGLKGAVTDHGADQIGWLVSPSATAEEMFLAGKLARALGGRNIDARLREGDTSDQDLMPAFPSLGQPVADLEQADAVLLVGSNPRNDQPIVNHRLRKAALRGSRIQYLNPRRFEFNYPVAGQRVVSAKHLVDELAAVAKAALDLASEPAPEGLDGLLGEARPGDEHRALAESLKQADAPAVLLGNLAGAHPEAAALRALGQLVADATGARLGMLTEGSNTAGAWLSGAVPHRQAGGKPEAQPGLTARAMLEDPLEAYVLLGVEPEMDCWDGRQAREAMERAGLVVALTPYVTDAMREYADVLLPVATFGETSGTFVNAEGRWQSFAGVGHPVGEARPAWKVLRVMGNLFDIEGFEYEASDQIAAEVKSLAGETGPNGRVEWRAPARKGFNGALLRTGSVPLYAVDSLVRRAKALQGTTQAAERFVRVAPALAAKLGVEEGEHVHVRQGGSSVQLALAVDDSLADDTVWVPAAIAETADLGPMFGDIEIERA